MPTKSNLLDIELLKRLKAGDEEAFEYLYQQYGRRIYGKFSRMVKIREEVEELFQELFVRVWERRAQIDVEQPFSAYLYRIAENMVYDFYRKASRTETLRKALAVQTQEPYEHIEQALFKKETHDILQQAINTLPPQRRQAFVLCKIEEKSYEEAATIMGISPHTVHNHIVKGTRTLKAYFRDHQNPTSALLLLLALSTF